MNNKINKVILGETCLCEFQLYRTGFMDGPHGCFDFTAIHLDSLKQVVEDNFDGLLNKENLEFLNYQYYPEIFYTKWLNTKYSGDKDNMFAWAVCSLFHLDALESGRIECEEKQKSYQRKINRTRTKFEDHKPTLLFYYYKPNKNYNVSLLKEKLEEFIDFIQKKYKKKFLVSLITYKEEKEKSIKVIEKNNIHHTIFHTPNDWAGADDNWSGESDNDLFDQYISNIKDFVKKIK